MAWMILLGVLFGSGIALAQEAVQVTMTCTDWWCPLLAQFPSLSAWVVAIFTFISLTLRASAELLGFIGKQLANGNASAWAKRAGEWAVIASRIVGWFGGGTPKAAKEAIVAKAPDKTNG